MRSILVLFSILLVLSSCGSSSEMPTTSESTKNFTYLALGDSYTIGESVSESERWPVQLTQKFRDSGYLMQSPKIIARTGWRTDELLAAMDEQLGEEKYDLVSILIGVNNQYQGRDLEQFQEELELIIQQAIQRSKNGADGVFLVSIPDYSVTPFAQGGNVDEIAHEIMVYNERCMVTSSDYGVDYIYITDISEEAATNPELIAGDGLHPSGEMYRRWVERIFPQVKGYLNE
ncbi:SGNH/GDSL hydrolase family protein [Mesonia sp.]|uniref:SGNH/GDSL hydrolase family protein n=1 Tax=Mesonia sp. TaxID=1960830 RepID=UPI00177566E2|nr:SGNH/GDSL hydrolase family protein [Mesonia sp.]HIB36081.1 SGNH/GDSL hydrolase family protein [Mesonia sp.]HIO26564.1 SGNH/GDSL hydrolase family protein [Flavobacteriaceae bacterium]